MGRILTNKTPVEMWHSLVTDATALSHSELNTDMESYLVITLQTYTEKPQAFFRAMALDYLKSQDVPNTQQRHELRNVGDTCLLISGLFPERATKAQVPVSYFVNLGRHAYNNVAELYDQKIAMADLYKMLRSDFVNLMDVLLCMRELGSAQTALSPLQASDLWQKTGSRQALTVLQSLAEKINDDGVVH